MWYYSFFIILFCEDGCSLHYCARTGALSSLTLPPVKRPPFMKKPRFIPKNEILDMFEIRTEVRHKLLCIHWKSVFLKCLLKLARAIVFKKLFKSNITFLKMLTAVLSGYSTTDCSINLSIIKVAAVFFVGFPVTITSIFGKWCCSLQLIVIMELPWREYVQFLHISFCTWKKVTLIYLFHFLYLLVS